MSRIKGKIVHSNVRDDSSFEKDKIFDRITYAESFDVIVEDDEGRMYAIDVYERNSTQINFNPFTGKPAKVKTADFKGYEIWATQGQGGVQVDTKNTLQEALLYVKEHEGEASYGIKLPDGSWYEWPKKEPESAEYYRRKILSDDVARLLLREYRGQRLVVLVKAENQIERCDLDGIVNAIHGVHYRQHKPVAIFLTVDQFDELIKSVESDFMSKLKSKSSGLDAYASAIVMSVPVYVISNNSKVLEEV